MIRDTLRSEESATLLRDEDIVLDADATEVLIGLQLVEIQEFLAMPAGLPVVDEGRNEIDTWLVGHHEAFFQLTTHTQTVGTKLFQIRTCLLVEAHVDLSETLHIVHVHTHHMSQSVRQEHRVGTR